MKEDTDSAYKLVKKHFGKREMKRNIIRTANGDILMECEGNGWRLYFGEL
jgi:hypothetical protein